VTLIDRIGAHLERHAVPHALIGAAALAAAGIARSTFDIDLLTTDDRVLRIDLWEPLPAEGVAIDVRRGDDDDPLAGVVRLEMADDRPVDLIVGRHMWQTRAVERAPRLPGGLPVVLPRDLVLLKVYAGGTQDLGDVRALLTLADAAQLIADVEEDLQALPSIMQERWGTARAR
jgi:hypothetical protein